MVETRFEQGRLESGFPPLSRTVSLGGESALFRIERGSAPGADGNRELTWVDLPAPEVARDDGEMTLRYPERDGLSVTVRFVPGDAEVTCRIALELTEGAPVCRVQFPYIEWPRVHTFDRLLMSSPWGDDIPRPTRTIRDFCAQQSTALGQTYIQRGDNEVIYQYPSILAMQYLVLHNPARSLYLSRYGTGEESFTLNARVLGKSALALSVVHLPFLASGRWESPECGFALLEGDWHGAADLYAERMRDEFPPPDVPDWLREEFHGWAGLMMKREGEPADLRFQDLPDVYRRVQAAGLNTLHVCGWSGVGFDTRYPDYDLNPELGTLADLRAALDEIHRMGGRVILYTNFRLVDPESRFWREGGEKAVCRGRDGEPYVEGYGTSPQFRVACPGDSSYREYLVAQVARIADEYGADALQADQVSCNLQYLCYDAEHAHRTPATNFLPGMEALLKETRAAYRAANPEFWVWAEGCHERYGRFYDVEQGHAEELTWQIGESLGEQFAYTFPGRIVTGISRGLQQLCETYAQGKPFDVWHHSLDEPGFTGLLRDLVRVRRELPRYFSRGVFRDSVGLGVTGGVRVYGIEGADGQGLLVNLWMPGAQPGDQCRTLLRHGLAAGEMQCVYPASMSAQGGDGWAALSWRGPVATLVFSG